MTTDERPHPAEAAGTRLVTLDLDDASSDRFETLRRTYFPPERNRVPAHVMLFHRFEAEHDAVLRRDLQAEASTLAAFAAIVDAPRSIGSGVAYDLVSTELLSLRARLAVAWRPWLIPQDRETYRPHVVVQNKVDAATARATLSRLRESSVPDTVRATGVILWTYRNGTWHDPQTFAFADGSGGRPST